MPTSKPKPSWLKDKNDNGVNDKTDKKNMAKGKDKKKAGKGKKK